MFIKDLQENYDSYNLPEEFAFSIPSVCPSCGSLLEMSEVLTKLHCSNPRCPNKVAVRVKAICDKLGILGMGDSTIDAFIDYHECINPLNIFEFQLGMPLGTGISQEQGDKIISQILEKKNFQLWEYVQIANIPGVQTCARDIFGDYSNLEDAYRDIEDGGVAFIQRKLGLAGDENGISIRSIQVYNNLMTFKEDLFEDLPFVNIISYKGKKVINIYCSDQAGGGFKHKKDFYAYIESHFGEKVHFEVVGSINKKLNYLIWAGADGTPCRITSKVATVQKYQDQGYDIPIMTASQFIEHMEGLI